MNTHLLDAGVDPLKVQLYLWGKTADDAEQGKTSRLTKTQAIYTHLLDRMTEPVAQAIEKLYKAGKGMSEKASGTA